LGGYPAASSGAQTTVQYTTINSNGTLNTWQTTTALPNQIGNQSATRYNGYIYMVGNGGAASATIQYAPINSDYTLGSWTVITTALQTARTYTQLIAVNGYIYAIGGADGSSVPLTTVEYARINANASLGSFAYTSSLATGRARSTTVYQNGYMFAIGGNTNSANTTDTNTVEYTKLNTNGTMAAWQYNTSLPETLKNQAVTTYNGYIYSLGGTASGVRSITSYYTAINNGGSGAPGAWQAGSSFTTARANHGAVAANGYLYVFGGNDKNSTVVYGDVQYAKINDDGSVGTWASTTSLSFVNAQFAATAYNGYLYMLGGYDNVGGGGVRNTVQYAKMNVDGTLGPWAATTNLPKANFKESAVAYNNYMYILGGNNSGYLADVYFAPINSDGTLGSWTPTTSITIARSNGAAFASGGYLYILGGIGTGTNNYLNDTQYAPINSDGTVGTWKSSQNFVGPRSGLSLSISNGYVYIVGGFNGTFYNDVQYAPLLSGGGIGGWQQTADVGGTVKRFNAATVIANGYIYVTGGAGATSVTNNTQYALLNVISRVSHYSKLIDLGTASNVTQLTFNGLLNQPVADFMYRAAGSNGIFGPLNPGIQVSGSGGCAGNVTNTQFIWLYVTLDGSTDGSFPDISDNVKQVQDITVSYSAAHPAPNIRLRGGQTLQQGNLSALDTCRP